MAHVDLETKMVIFDNQDLRAAWNNAPILENKNSDNYRLCYICKYPLKFDVLAKDETQEFGWTVDLINAKKPTLTPTNFVAVHQNCIPNRLSLDSRKQLKQILSAKWEFDSTYWSE